MADTPGETGFRSSVGAVLVLFPPQRLWNAAIAASRIAA
jgi:hypothetical protein